MVTVVVSAPDTVESFAKGTNPPPESTSQYTVGIGSPDASDVNETDVSP